MIKCLPLGHACNLDNLFLTAPLSYIGKLKTKAKKIALYKKIFKAGLHLIIDDIIKNNTTFIFPKFSKVRGELHIEGTFGREFREGRKMGRFKGVDFLESNFSGYQIYMYLKYKGDSFFYKKIPVYIGKEQKDKLLEQVNSGRPYG